MAKGPSIGGMYFKALSEPPDAFCGKVALSYPLPYKVR